MVREKEIDVIYTYIGDMMMERKTEIIKKKTCNQFESLFELIIERAILAQKLIPIGETHHLYFLSYLFDLFLPGQI